MTEIESIRIQKKKIREKMRSERDKLTAKDALAAGKRIVETILAGSLYGISPEKESMIGLYISDRNEPDFSGMLDTLKSKGIRFCFPAVRSGTIEFLSLPSEGVFVKGELGIPEPGHNAYPVQPEEIDIILVPGMAFDRGGGRLGRGKGLFDRYLAAIAEVKRPLFVGTGHDFQFLDYVPLEDTDILMDFIVTPERCLRTSREAD